MIALVRTKGRQTKQGCNRWAEDCNRIVTISHVRMAARFMVCQVALISHNTMTPVLVAVSAIIIVVAMHLDPDAEYTGVYRCGLAWCGCIALAACAVLALEDAGHIPDAGPPCVVLALEDSGPPRTYRMSSLLFCVGLLGWQLLAVLHRTTSSAEQLRDSTALLRASSRLLLPPFAIVGALYLVLGGGMGFQQLPLLRKLQVVCVEIALFTLGPVLITRPRYIEPARAAWAVGWPRLCRPPQRSCMPQSDCPEVISERLRHA